jgi:hypothetical protein
VLVNVHLTAKCLDSQPIDTPKKDKVVSLPCYRFARDPADYKSIHEAPQRETFEEKLERLYPVSKHGNAMLGIWNCIMADQIIEEEKQSCKKRKTDEL